MDVGVKGRKGAKGDPKVSGLSKRGRSSRLGEEEN